MNNATIVQEIEKDYRNQLYTRNLRLLEYFHLSMRKELAFSLCHSVKNSTFPINTRLFLVFDVEQQWLICRKKNGCLAHSCTFLHKTVQIPCNSRAKERCYGNS